ncbi:hypothetical protein AGOR_G00195440 [Albula goreensis]|uniref:NAD(P)(+)--arginine ADP-ribosyltransferase n=1 Tax=Albula goreensis TaxID=1534307 RepID=A0A8T3CRL4_9TELE|nr:hypothetical protein AGOR_G00195440 [Albula goreensis]
MGDIRDVKTWQELNIQTGSTMGKCTLVFAVWSILTLSQTVNTNPLQGSGILPYLFNVGGVPLPLDMAPDSVDDSYKGCTMKMLKYVLKKLLRQELSQDAHFSQTWKAAKQAWMTNKQPLHAHMREEHAVALFTYTLGGANPFYAKFNQATITGGKGYGKGKFQYKSLHFLLANALRLIKDSDGSGCLTVYRRSLRKFKKAHVGAKVRFGSFASSSQRMDLTNFGSETCFVVKTCLGAKIRKYSAFVGEEEVLIPPYEKFKITQKNHLMHPAGLQCNLIYTLQSRGMHSRHTCTSLKHH